MLPRGTPSGTRVGRRPVRNAPLGKQRLGCRPIYHSPPKKEGLLKKGGLSFCGGKLVGARGFGASALRAPVGHPPPKTTLPEVASAGLPSNPLVWRHKLKKPEMNCISGFLNFGARGFEPPTTRTPSVCAIQAALRPDQN